LEIINKEALPLTAGTFEKSEVPTTLINNAQMLTDKVFS